MKKNKGITQTYYCLTRTKKGFDITDLGGNLLNCDLKIPISVFDDYLDMKAGSKEIVDIITHLEDIQETYYFIRNKIDITEFHKVIYIQK
jgi:hypothetical protein